MATVQMKKSAFVQGSFRDPVGKEIRSGNPGGESLCSASGSGNFAAHATLPIERQLEEGKARVRGKITDKEYGFIAYFQSFSSTYGDVSLQRKLFTRAISDPEVVALSVATRPDCLPEEVLELLKELSAIKPVWVELGLQTTKAETVELIRRGYPNEVFEKAVSELTARGIEVIVHLILGLPGESHEDEIASLKAATHLPVRFSPAAASSKPDRFH